MMPVLSRKAQDAAFRPWIHSSSMSRSFSQPGIPRDARDSGGRRGAGPGLGDRNRCLSHEAFGGLLGDCPVWFPPPPPRKVSALRQKLGKDREENEAQRRKICVGLRGSPWAL